MADKPGSIQVEIFGQSYAVKAGADPRYVEELAAYVDSQMREVGRSAGAVDTVRIAVLAALNIADERFRLKSSLHDAEEGGRVRAEGLVRELSAALEDLEE